LPARRTRPDGERHQQGGRIFVHAGVAQLLELTKDPERAKSLSADEIIRIFRAGI
jgi:hypothetical protein